MNTLEWLHSFWPWIFSGGSLLIHVISSVHVVLTKRNASAAIGWIGAIWLAPVLGPLLYFFFGINRIQRKARRLRGWQPPLKPLDSSAHFPSREPSASLAPEAAHLAPLVQLVGAIAEEPLLPGNKVMPLHNGAQAYPAMLQAIHEAQQTINLSTYIFNNDQVGILFVAALKQAVQRKVEVRVLIDDIGGHYTWQSVFKLLRQGGVTVNAFLPKLVPRYISYANLCNHRKLLIVDGRVGFTGGMNISEDHDPTLHPPRPMQDVHFRIDGPIVAQLQEVFADDWEFSTGEALQGKRWYPEIKECGSVSARGISSGPDADVEKLHVVYCGALTCARNRVLIMTPYFLPDPSLIVALNVAALRGIQVDILLPEENDMHLLQWASTLSLCEILEYGCRIWLTPPPLTHTKLILVDGSWTLLGSGNWDPRSLRLNFEFDLECYDQALASALEETVRKALEASKPMTLAQIQDRSFPAKLRDGIARLLTPYL